MAGHRKYSYGHLLTTNAAPLPTEIVSIRHGLESLETRVSGLRSQLEELVEDLHQHEGAISWMRQIPVDVLGEIFGHAFTPSRALNNYGRGQLVGLSLVCRRWREAALCSPRLWSRVKLSPDELSFEKFVSWLGRSGSIPKTLEICLCSDDGRRCAEVASDCKSNSAALAKLLTHGPPLDHLSLKIRETQCLRNLVDALNFCAILSGPMARPWESIRSFTLTADGEWDPNEIEDADDSTLLYLPASITDFCFQIPPSLYIDFGSPISSFIPPSLLHRLTSLSLSWDWDDEYIYHVLRACHTKPLETLTLDVKSYSTFQDPDSAEFSNFSQILLPRLRSLNLRIPLRAHNLLRILRSPSLVSLSVRFYECGLGSSFPLNVIAFVEASQCQPTLRSLTICDCIFETQYLTSLFAVLPFLTHLELDNFHLHDLNIFAHLSSSNPRILPHLEILELRRPPCIVEFSVIENVLKSRWPFQIARTSTPTGLIMDDYVFQGPPDSLKQVLVTYREQDLETWNRLEVLATEDTPFINALRRHCGVVVSVSICEESDEEDSD